ncbi:MAG TPA: flotillin-like protein FloA [Planctomycetota bacterium]|nr:flotillin-like protein FloA [Planctomycetota bacterium]
MTLPILAQIDGVMIALIAVGLFALFLLIFLAKYFSLYVRALFSRAQISLIDLFGMGLRKVNASLIVNSKIKIVQAGLASISTQELEAHYLAGGNVAAVVDALVAADRAGIELPFKTAAAIDLAGRDVRGAIRTSVDPKVIDCPNSQSGKQVISAMAQDGIELRVKARVTVRTHIPRLVGGATEETIIARVGEGILTTIGSAKSHRQVLENPDTISKTVLNKGLDSGTAFEILSIDIADIDVGKNIGSELQTHQAQADLLVAQAKAEERKAMAIAREHEMRADVAENQAKLVLAETQVPEAIAYAFRSGHLGIMDYLRIKNVEADTSMRSSFGKVESKPS